MHRELQIRVLLAVMDFLERHPVLVRAVLRPLSRAPLLSGRLMVLAKYFMGNSAFEIHDVDLDRGRISIGGVEEIMFGSRVVEQLHSVLGRRLGEEQAREALYEIGYNLCRWEVSTALEGGRWAPRLLVPLIARGDILDDVRSNPLIARFFVKTMDAVSRLITDEGGWGHLEFEGVRSVPMLITLRNSQEAGWLGPSKEPVCHLYAGIVAGYASAISGREMRAREVECRAAGAPACVFQIED